MSLVQDIYDMDGLELRCECTECQSVISGEAIGRQRAAEAVQEWLINEIDMARYMLANSDTDLVNMARSNNTIGYHVATTSVQMLRALIDRLEGNLANE